MINQHYQANNHKRDEYNLNGSGNGSMQMRAGISPDRQSQQQRMNSKISQSQSQQQSYSRYNNNELIRYQSLIDALNSADVDKIDVQKLFELCKDIQSSQLKASIVLEALVSSEYGQQGLDLLIQLLYAPNDQRKVQLNRIPDQILGQISINPSVLADIKKCQYVVDDQRQIWCYPKFDKNLNTSQLSQAQSKYNKRLSLETEDEKDAFEFNDLETDERINIDIFQFDMSFPDPKDYCLGFIVKDLERKQQEELKISTISNLNQLNRFSDDQSDVVLHDYKTDLTESGSPQSKFINNYNAQQIMSPSERHKMLIQNEYLTQSRKASGYTNYVTGEANSQQNSRTHVTDYNTQKSNHSSLTTGGNVSNQVSGKGLQSKNGQGSNTSSLGTAPIHHTNANLTHKIDLSASLDLKNIQFKKIGANKIQNKQTFLEQYRKSKQLDTGDIGGSLPISQLISQNPNDLENRVSPLKQLHAKPQFEEKKSFKIAKPIQKGTGIKISRNIDQIINRNALNAPQGRSSVIKGAMDLSHNQTASHHHNLEDTLTSVHGNEGNMVQKAPMSSKFNQLLLTSSFNKNIIGGINNHKAGPTKIVSASINFQSHKNTNPGSFVGSARNN
eukprot:403337876